MAMGGGHEQQYILFPAFFQAAPHGVRQAEWDIQKVAGDQGHLGVPLLQIQGTAHHGIMRTRDAVSPIAVSQVATSLVAFVLVYSLLGFVDFYLLFKFARKGPAPDGELAAVADVKEQLA